MLPLLLLDSPCDKINRGGSSCWSIWQIYWTYLRAELRGWGRDPWSSMTKLIGLTKSLGLKKHIQTQRHRSFPAAAHTLNVVQVSLSWRKHRHWDVGESLMRSSSLLSTSTDCSSPSHQISNDSSLTMNAVGCRCSCPLPSVFKPAGRVVLWSLLRTHCVWINDPYFPFKSSVFAPLRSASRCGVVSLFVCVLLLTLNPTVQHI